MAGVSQGAAPPLGWRCWEDVRTPFLCRAGIQVGLTGVCHGVGRVLSGRKVENLGRRKLRPPGPVGEVSRPNCAFEEAGQRPDPEKVGRDLGKGWPEGLVRWRWVLLNDGHCCRSESFGQVGDIFG